MRRKQPVSKPVMVDEVADKQAVLEVKPLAKSADPEFIKFTTYIKKTTHLAVKMRMVGEQREMSDLVEDLLSRWLKEKDADES